MLRRSPITNPALWKEKVGYWDDVYGVRMGALKEFAVKSSFGTDCAVNVSAPDPLLSPPGICLARQGWLSLTELCGGALAGDQPRLRDGRRGADLLHRLQYRHR